VPPDFVRGQVEVTPGLGAYRPSSLIDFEAGRPVELEAIWGEPLRRARAAGVPAPRLERLHAKLSELVGAGGASS
jgi:2-dehydropantoate 2-reductase